MNFTSISYELKFELHTCITVIDDFYINILWAYERRRSKVWCGEEAVVTPESKTQKEQQKVEIFSQTLTQ